MIFFVLVNLFTEYSQNSNSLYTGLIQIIIIPIFILLGVFSTITIISPTAVVFLRIKESNFRNIKDNLSAERVKLQYSLIISVAVITVILTIMGIITVKAYQLLTGILL